jgi:hypothetical protein
MRDHLVLGFGLYPLPVPFVQLRQTLECVLVLGGKLQDLFVGGNGGSKEFAVFKGLPSLRYE